MDIRGQDIVTDANRTVVGAETNEFVVASSVSNDGSGTRLVTNTATNSDRSIASVTKSVTSPDEHRVTTTNYDNGDGVVIQWASNDNVSSFQCRWAA
jgi:hypothetical protein